MVTGAPYIDLNASGTEDLKKRVDKALTKAEKAEKKLKSNPKNSDTIRGKVDELFIKYHKLRRKLFKENASQGKKVIALLEEFYKDWNVPYNRHIIIWTFPDGSFRIESQGACFQEVEEPEIKKRKLAEYQQEMKEFTKFLKNKYFSS